MTFTTSIKAFRLYLIMAASVIWLSSASHAATILTAGWQELLVRTWAFDGSPTFTDVQHTAFAGIPGSRSLNAQAVIPHTSASSSVSQSATVNNNSIEYEGSLTAEQSGIFPLTQALMSVHLRFDVTGQNETITIALTHHNVSGYDNIYNSGYSDNFGIGNSGGAPAVPQTYVRELSPGSYEFRAGAGETDNSYQDASYSVVFAGSVSFSNLSYGPGWDQGHPLPPDVRIGDDWVFSHVASHAWIDPPTTSGFDFRMTGPSLFTSIDSFPTGFSSPFEVLAGSISLGFFTSSDSVDFQNLLGHGVSEFSVRNIHPLVDGGDPLAFPIQLGFNTSTADFTMTPVPEPSSLLLLGLGAIGMGPFARRRRGPTIHPVPLPTRKMPMRVNDKMI